MRYACLLAVAIFLFPCGSIAQQSTLTYPEELSAAKAELAAAEGQVKAIINQPVTRAPYNSFAIVKVFKPGWFHPGAAKPDFANVDIRKTQEFPYKGSNWVTSHVTPGYMFPSSELEFNSNTKYYYLDRNLPKKRLTEAEMLQVNSLYRVIGKDEQEIAKLQGMWFPYLSFGEFMNSRLGMVAQLIAVVLLGLITYFVLFGRKRRY